MSASFAILKHCRPNGIPITVQHSIAPLIAAHIAKGIPLMSIQKTFAMIDGAPPPYCTSLPNGANTRDANLKHCRPKGIPTIVIHHMTPINPHARACHIPPHNIQIKLPRQPIKFPSLSRPVYQPRMKHQFDAYENCIKSARILSPLKRGVENAPDNLATRRAFVQCFIARTTSRHIMDPPGLIQNDTGTLFGRDSSLFPICRQLFS